MGEDSTVVREDDGDKLNGGLGNDTIDSLDYHVDYLYGGDSSDSILAENDLGSVPATTG